MCVLRIIYDLILLINFPSFIMRWYDFNIFKSLGNLFHVFAALNVNENFPSCSVDLVLNPWETTEDGQRRRITYTVSLNHPIGPKHSPTTEQQVSFTNNKFLLFFLRYFRINTLSNRRATRITQIIKHSLLCKLSSLASRGSFPDSFPGVC